MNLKKLSVVLAVTALTTSIFAGCSAKAESSLKDGTYTATSEADERGYVASIELTVEEGKISAVKYDEKDAEGVSKLDQADYNTKMEEISGTSPIAAYPALEEALVEKQDVDAVDTVTGATTSSDSFKALAKEALEAAK